MSLPNRAAGVVTSHSRLVVVCMLLVTVLLGAGIPLIEADVDLEEITGDSAEARANDYVQDNFTSTGQPNTTAVLLVRTGNNTLTRDSLLRSLRLQKHLRENRSIDRTLASGDPITGIENVVAISVIADRLAERADRVNATSDRLAAGLDEIRTLQREFENDTAGLEENSSAYRERELRLEADVRAVREEVTESLNGDQQDSYRGEANSVRIYESRLVELERQYGEEATERSGYKQFEVAINGSYDWARFAILEANFSAVSRAAAELEDGQPPLDRQIAVLQDETLTRSQYRDHVRDALNGTGPRAADVLRLVSSSYRVDTTTASARMTVILQHSTEGGGIEGVTNRTLITAQQHVRHLATNDDAEAGLASGEGTTGDNATGATAQRGQYIVFGSGLVEHEIDQSMVDTLAIVIPLALLLVVLALAIAYRDPLDILLGLFGIACVLVWTFGLLGWFSIPFNVLLVAVPVLLIGISIDFAIHVIMRHREHRTPADPGDPPHAIRPAMTTAIAGVAIALFWAAATTVIGFFANVVSPLSLIRQFGFASGFGIASALLVFTTLVPAVKIELDERLEARGFDRHRRAFGTAGGRLSRVLAVGQTAARRAPLGVIALLVIVTAASGAAATTVDTTFQQEDFIAHSPPGWTYSLPGAMAPGQYHTAEDLEVVNEHFRPADAQAQLLVRGDVNTTAAFRRLVDARRTAAGTPAVYTLPNGRADIQDPLSVMRTVADEDDRFNESFRAADTDNDSVPERNIPELYEDLYDADRDAASQVIHRTADGEFAAVRLLIGVQGGASYAETTNAMRRIATSIEEGEPENGTASSDENSTLTAVATGRSVVNRVIEQALFETLTRSFVVTLVAVFLVLTIGYRLAGRGATLGAVTLVPVILSVAWILGAMAVLDVPFNVLTVMITSLTIGLGVSYCIHVSARYRIELDRQDDAWSALHTTLTGTGGALLGSVATTTAAFGTLGLAILPVLAQFGLITAVTIVYTFLASVLALPTLLVLWTKYARPGTSMGPPDDGSAAGNAGSDGTEAD